MIAQEMGFLNHRDRGRVSNRFGYRLSDGDNSRANNRVRKMKRMASRKRVEEGGLDARA